MNLVPNPADELASAMSTHIFHKNLGFGKNALDLISIVLSAAIGWFGAHSLLGVGIGTLCCMIFTSRVIALIRKPLDHLYDFAVTGRIPARGTRESVSAKFSIYGTDRCRAFCSGPFLHFYPFSF